MLAIRQLGRIVVEVVSVCLNVHKQLVVMSGVSKLDAVFGVLPLLVVVVLWYLLQAIVLPKLGIGT
ncbi:hypothetical protein BH23CHL5_BH23CHL5_18210 [soil metagenome]